MKKIILFIISFLLFINVASAIDLDINSKYAYVYNLTEDKIMYEKSAYDEIKIASLTKIMTAIIVIENNKDLDKEITILDEDLRDMYEYTTAGFQNGNKVTIKDLLYGILLPSGSDAVNAAVRVTSGIADNFVDLMNQKVKELSLTHTYFSNPIGKDEDNYSSMSDIAAIMKYCLKNKTFKNIISTQTYTVPSLNLQLNGPLYNSLNKYEIDTSMVSGAKSGYTTESKFSMISYSETSDTKYIVATSYAENYKKSLIDTSNIYTYFINNYGYQDYNINFNIDIEHSKEKKYNVNIDTKLYLKNDYDKSLITYKYDGRDKINFLIKKNDKIGKISIYYDKELIKTQDIRLNKNIKYKARAYLKLSTFLIVIIGLIGVSIFIKLKKKKAKIKKQIKKELNNDIKISEPIKTIIEKKNSIEDNISVLNTTLSVGKFFEVIKDINDKEKKKNYEHNFIDRCFENVDFTNMDELKTLYTRLKLYKNDMEDDTINYYNKLFKYCVENYIDKN